MSMISWPFDSTVTDDGEGNPIYSKAYSSEVIARILAKYFSNGVFSDVSTNLQVVANSGLDVDVSPGDCLINGHHGYLEAAETLTLSAASATYPRIDTIVLRLDLGAGVLSVDPYVVTGTAAATPSAPALTRNSTVYELGIANIYVAANATAIVQANITDTRLNSDRCGIIAAIIDDVDTTTFFDQFEALLAEKESVFEAWFQTAQDTLDEDSAGNLLNLINNYRAYKTTAAVPGGVSNWTIADGKASCSVALDAGTPSLVDAIVLVSPADQSAREICAKYAISSYVTSDDSNHVFFTANRADSYPETSEAFNVNVAIYRVDTGTGNVGIDECYHPEHVVFDLLWENENPGLPFAEQTVDLSLSDYAYVEVFSNVSTTLGALSSVRVEVGNTNSSYISGSAGTVMRDRRFYATTSGVAFRDARKDGSTDNTSVIPTRIYGIRGLA